MSNQKTIVLFNPKSSEIARKKGVLPLALLAIASELHKEGYKIVIIDEMLDTFDESILDNNILCFGISAMIGYQINGALKIAKRVREINPNIPIVWGGWHPSILPEQTMESDYVDFLVYGQGEITFYELVKALEAEKQFEDISGLCFKRDNEIIKNQPRALNNPNEFPPLPYELIDMGKYINSSEYGRRTINYLSSIGCPFRCGFCAEQLVHHRKWLALSAERVVSDIEYLYGRYNIDSVMINDSEFFINQKRVNRICQGLLEKNINIKWGNANGRADVLSKYSEKTWNLMVKSGLQSILTGAETYDEEILKIINKDETVEDTINLAKLAKKYGVIIKFSMMIGLPIENRNKTIEQEFNDTIDFINDMYKINSSNVFLLFLYTPFPGTSLYETSIKLGYKAPTSLNEWGDFLEGLNHKSTPWTNQKIADKVYQVNFYFPFASNFVNTIVKGFPLVKKILFLPFERILYVLMAFRLKNKLFGCPIEYFIVRKLMGSFKS